MRCLDRVSVCAAMIVIGLTTVGIVLWDSDGLRRGSSEVRVGEVTRQQAEIQSIVEQIRCSDEQITHLRHKLRTLEQARL